MKFEYVTLAVSHRSDRVLLDAAVDLVLVRPVIDRQAEKIRLRNPRSYV